MYSSILYIAHTTQLYQSVPFASCKLRSIGKLNGLVEVVKDGVILTHKDVSKDPLGSGSVAKRIE